MASGNSARSHVDMVLHKSAAETSVERDLKSGTNGRGALQANRTLCILFGYGKMIGGHVLRYFHADNIRV